MSVYGGPDIVTDGLVLHLDAGNTKSYPGAGNTWFDLSGNNHNGTIFSGVSHQENAFIFDGSQGYIVVGRIPYTSSNLSSVSWGIWVNPINDTHGNIMSMSNINPQGSWNMPPIAADGQRFVGKIWPNNKIYSSTYSLNKWYYIVLVWKYSTTSSGQFLYINGELVGYQNGIVYSGSNAADGNYLFLGQQNPGADNTGMFSGQISHFHIYGNKALSDVEIKQNFNALKGRFGL